MLHASCLRERVVFALFTRRVAGRRCRFDNTFFSEIYEKDVTESFFFLKERLLISQFKNYIILYNSSTNNADFLYLFTKKPNILEKLVKFVTLFIWKVLES